MERNFVCGWFIVMMMLLVVTPAVSAQPADVAEAGQTAQPARFHVDCDRRGQKLSRAIERAKPGDTITVRGTCNERVTVTIGPLTLDGGGNAVLDGTGVAPNELEFNGLITVDGARGVKIRGWAIRNGAAEGILGIRSAGISIQDTVVENNAVGIGLSNSTAEVVDSAMRHNLGGIDAFSSSTVIFRGRNDLSQNRDAGLILNGNSLAEIRGGHLQVNNNGGQGILVSTHSTLVIFGFEASQGTRLTTSGNKGQGMIIFNGHFFVAGGTFAPGSVVVTSSGNAAQGMFLSGGSVNSPFGAARFVVENNPIGMDFQQGSTALIIGGLNVRNNTTAGIQTDNAAGLTLVSIPPNPSAIQSNGTDVILGFGSKSTIEGVAVGKIVCDGTVLSRGTTVCP